MIVLLLFAFLSGLVTIAAPCIWPLLPIVLSSSSTGGKKKPLGIVLGIMISFAFFTLSLSYIVKIIPFDPNVLRLFAVIVIGFLGLTLVIPQLSKIVEGAVSHLSSGIGTKTRQIQGDGFIGGLITGLALGIVWSPCAGPILATIATLAATQAVSFQLILITLVYVSGVGIPLLLFATLGNRIFSKSRALNKHTARIQQIFGIIMIITAVAIFTNYDKVIQVKLLDAFPSYSNFLNQIEGNTAVKKQLDTLRGNKSDTSGQTNTKPKNFNMINDMPKKLPDLGAAPEFSGISQWLNIPAGKKALTMSGLKGKVVLIDFWTYTCIHCIRTLPHITSLYEKYKDKGFIVVGVHTPEFEFEKNTSNVEGAIKQYQIHYPVAQDNNYSTWQAFGNQYWPAEYLIDAKGTIRRTHFGEGEYEETEQAVKDLLKEKGAAVDESLILKPDTTPTGNLTPETYLGESRMERFASQESVQGGLQNFSVPDGLPLHYFAYRGNWNVSSESAMSGKDAALEFHFFASKVFLVITPHQAGDTITVLLDGKPIDQKIAGADVKGGVVTLDSARLYDLVNLGSKNEDHSLRLQFLNGNTEVFAFTFG